MSVSSVYVILEKTFSRRAASRVSARKPEVASGTSAPETRRTTQRAEALREALAGREIGLRRDAAVADDDLGPAGRIGATSAAMSAGAYWRSASVETMTSAPRRSAASRPARQANARPRWIGRRTTWSAPAARAASARPVGRAVVHDEGLDHVEAGERPRQLRERGSDLRRLVPGGDLDDELQPMAIPKRFQTTLALCTVYSQSASSMVNSATLALWAGKCSFSTRVEGRSQFGSRGPLVPGRRPDYKAPAGFRPVAPRRLRGRDEKTGS